MWNLKSWLPLTYILESVLRKPRNIETSLCDTNFSPEIRKMLLQKPKQDELTSRYTWIFACVSIWILFPGKTVEKTGGEGMKHSFYVRQVLQYWATSSEMLQCLYCSYFLHYVGADKFLARAERKQTTATADFDFHISYLLS